MGRGDRVLVALWVLWVLASPLSGQAAVTGAPLSSGAKIQGGKPLNLDSNEAHGQVLVDPGFGPCGQGCLYDKANENISLQYHFISKKLEFLGSEVDETGAANDAQAANLAQQKAELVAKKWDVLGPFCNEDEKSDHDTQALKDCIKRYRNTQDLWIAKVRKSLTTNDESHYQLGKYDSRIDPRKIVVIGRDKSQIATSQTPYFSKSADLGKFAKTAPTGPPTEADINAFKPEPSDFIKFAQVPRDPNDPSKGNFTIAKRDAAGNLDLDDEAYQCALKVWQGGKCQKLSPNPVASPTKTPSPKALTAQQPGYGVYSDLLNRTKDAGIKDDLRDDHQKFTQDFKEGVAGDSRSEVRKIYDDARRSYVDHINSTTSVKSNYQNTVSFPGQPPPPRYEPGKEGTPRTTGDENVNPSPNVEKHVVHKADGLYFRNEQMFSEEQRAKIRQGRADGTGGLSGLLNSPNGSSNSSSSGQQSGTSNPPAANPNSGTTTVPAYYPPIQNSAGPTYNTDLFLNNEMK